MFIQNVLICVLISKFKAKVLVLYISVLSYGTEVLNQEFLIGFNMFRIPKTAHILCVCVGVHFFWEEPTDFIRFSKGPMTPEDPPLHSGLCTGLQAEL